MAEVQYLQIMVTLYLLQWHILKTFESLGNLKNVAVEGHRLFSVKSRDADGSITLAIQITCFICLSQIDRVISS